MQCAIVLFKHTRKGVLGRLIVVRENKKLENKRSIHVSQQLKVMVDQ
jgi:hypothetical protein